jgi:hypothetical protein
MHKKKISNSRFWNLKEFNLHSVDFNFIYQIYCDELHQWNTPDNLQITLPRMVEITPMDLDQQLRITLPQ